MPAEQAGAYDKTSPHPGLDTNPGKTAQLFSNTHPYIKNAYPGAKEAVEKAVSKAELRKEEVVEVANGGKIRISNLVSRKDGDYDKIYQVADFFAKKGNGGILDPQEKTWAQI